MNKLEAILEAANLNDFLRKKEEETKKCNVVLWVLAVVGAVVAVGVVVYALYRHFKPDYLEDFEEEFEDDDEVDEDDEVFEDESDKEE